MAGDQLHSLPELPEEILEIDLLDDIRWEGHSFLATFDEGVTAQGVTEACSQSEGVTGETDPKISRPSGGFPMTDLSSGCDGDGSPI